MLIKEKLGNLHSFDVGARSIDRLQIEWFEASKRILHKRTQSGREVSIKFLNETQNLTQDDVLWVDDTIAIVIEIQTCEAICIRPLSMYEMATLCYEIGNKHLPLFYHDDELLIPYEVPLYKMLTAFNYNVKLEKRRLVDQLKTTVSPHGNTETKQGLFSKILQLTTSPNE